MNPAVSRRRALQGFTLIEAMITMAIIAIVASIAVPAYSSYVISGKLTDAFNQMSGLALSLEQYYQDNRTYVGACGATGNAQLPTATTYFTFSCPTLTATGYVVQATGNTGSSTSGFAFTLDQAGGRSTPSAPSGWNTSTTCWVNSRSGGCQ